MRYKLFCEKQLQENDNEKKGTFNSDIRKMDIEHDVHLTKAQVFYGRKKEAKNSSRASSHKEAIGYVWILLKLILVPSLLQMTPIIEGNCPSMRLIFTFCLTAEVYFIYIHRQ